MSLDYALYKTKSPAERNNELLLLQRSIENVDSKQAKSFLRDLFSDQLQDFYLRKRALQLMGYLTLIKRIKPESVIALIIDIEDTEDEFIVVSALKLASNLHHLSKSSIISWAQNLALSNKLEVRSEAYLLLGRNSLFEGLSTNNVTSFISHLEEAKTYFDKSNSEIENRIDASMFLEVVVFLLKIKTQPNNPIPEIYERLQSKLWTYISLNTHEEDTLFFVNICHPISVLHQIVSREPDNWINFRTEVTLLLQALLKLDIRVLTKNLVQESIIDGYMVSVKERIIMELLSTKLGSHIARLRRIKDEMLVDTPEQMGLLDELLEYLVSVSDKKKDLSNSIEIIARLHSAFPFISLNKINEDIQAVDLTNPVNISQLFEQYVLEYRQLNPTELETGYPQGDEIHKVITQEIKKLLPTYPQGKLLEFMLVLRDVINYFIIASRSNSSRMPLLFKSDALEIELQNSMMIYFNTSKRADRYSPEVIEAADGGRVDILFRGNYIQLPIELKKSNQILDWDNIKKNYISQAQTYAHTRDQLAFFVVLDLSEKNPARPSPNVRDLVKAIHLDTKHELDTKFPDYVVCFIIPANKISPHKRSNYN